MTHNHVEDMICMLSQGNEINLAVEESRRVVATRSLERGDIIGPATGIPIEAVIDPVHVLQDEVGRTILECCRWPSKKDFLQNFANTSVGIETDEAMIKRQLEEMAFWITLAGMANDAYLRTEGGEPKRKKRRMDEKNGADNDNGGRRAIDYSDNPKCRQIHDAYLLSLPREGPDPCCWTYSNRAQLLFGTPLFDQISNTYQRTKEQYEQISEALRACDGERLFNGSIPPFSIDGRGVFPSVLWARSMHQSRSFPRSLVDEEGVWWMGRKGIVPNHSTNNQPDTSTTTESPLFKQVVGVPIEEIHDDSKHENNDGVDSATTTIVSYRLGGFSAPIIRISERSKRHQEADNHNVHQHPPPGYTLGIMLPLFDMLDHKPGHAVQWESAITITSDEQQQQSIRFRCCDPQKQGETIYNNYGPKGNSELLSTYGFAVKNNILDSVDGIMLGIKVPVSTDSIDSQQQQVFNAQMSFLKENNVSHRFDTKGGVILLGPFSLYRKGLQDATSCKNDDFADNDLTGVIPNDLYQALGVIGLETLEEGPVMSLDEMEMFHAVLKKKLDGFDHLTGSETTVTQTKIEEDVFTETERARKQSAEAYKDGQRALLCLAIQEIESLMIPHDEDVE
eukprot:scaffold36478_cov69-Cyclotella_meneghiniana.AAC.10